jgi:hypothetical protein
MNRIITRNTQTLEELEISLVKKKDDNIQVAEEPEFE